MTDAELSIHLRRADMIACGIAKKNRLYRPHKEDMKQVARIACWRAAQCYNPRKNSRFWGHAYRRVYGAVIDYLRAVKVVFRQDHGHRCRTYETVSLNTSKKALVALPHVAPDQYWRVVAQQEGEA